MLAKPLHIDYVVRVDALEALDIPADSNGRDTGSPYPFIHRRKHGNVQKRFRSDNSSVKAARIKKIVYDIFKIEKLVPYPVIINVWKHHHVRIRGKCRLGYSAYDILLSAVVGSCGYYGNIFLTFRSPFHALIKRPFPQPLNPCSAVNFAADGEWFLTRSATEYAGNELSYIL